MQRAARHIALETRPIARPINSLAGVRGCRNGRPRAMDVHGCAAKRCANDGFATRISVSCRRRPGRTLARQRSNSLPQGAALTAEGLRCGEGEETVVLLLSESSQGSSSVHEVHVPQGRGRQRRQAASLPSPSPGRVLPGFHKASEVLTQISWLLLPIPSSAFAQRKVARRYRSYSTYGRAASLVEAESDGWATAGPLTMRQQQLRQTHFALGGALRCAPARSSRC